MSTKIRWASRECKYDGPAEIVSKTAGPVLLTNVEDTWGHMKTIVAVLPKGIEKQKFEKGSWFETPCGRECRDSQKIYLKNHLKFPVTIL